MRIRSAQEAQKAITAGDIAPGMRYTSPRGYFIIAAIIDHPAIVAEVAEVDEDGEPIEDPHGITAADLVKAEF